MTGRGQDDAAPRCAEPWCRVPGCGAPVTGHGQDDREGLAEALGAHGMRSNSSCRCGAWWTAMDQYGGADQFRAHLADELLTSPWLAAHDAAARAADGAAEALREVEAIAQEQLAMNTPPAAINSEVVWFAEDILAALRVAALADPEDCPGSHDRRHRCALCAVVGD